MNRKTLFIAITIILAALTMATGRIIWPDPAGAETPQSNLIPFFVILSIFESVAFGIGIALLLYWRLAQRDLVVLIASVWLLISWWPHDNIHRVTDEHNFVYLLFIEYGFHVTLIIAGLIVAQFIIKQLKTKDTPSIN
ncbi:MAG: hypothetical protein COT81_03590 [Candidatus Buchananbacteria bacterium CG10_big_fil_rev_8_21_14_0_10_42_9]|uniref:Uncharacterized protein n=1 Tax=Candidatus Buchananbacteria bacterium CG10_big_fil_rev_8_21_14_0_10_42_9 TaxID=1974526 RepID=A0A2H0W2W2_9BACT|nr:MAG: hypothetical protein COT81_03590 [Candidatus Buchananbacteria bacterium CG10_big_fil_rev_8_21_14_0_10_42_9]